MRSFVQPHLLRSLFVLALLSGVLGCSSSSGSDGGCPTSYCNSHGVCTEKSFLPSCECEEGYEGLTCLTCAAGYHRIGSGTCALDETCEAATCGGHGTCAIMAGVVSCSCAVGYDGPRCDVCLGSFIDISDAGFIDAGVDAGLQRAGPAVCVPPPTCTPGSCAPGYDCDDSGGTIACVCAGTSCAANDCSSNPCGAHGTCDTATGLVRCTCEAGYQGAACGSCALGFHDASGGDGGVSCALNERCETNTCATGSCALNGGVAVCTCDQSTQGAYCQTCATGYHRAPSGNCESDQVCQSNSCPARANCVVAGGVISCPCQRGYAGSGCGQCAPGFHALSSADGGFACALDEHCSPTTCGGGSCEDGTGHVVCSNCPTGFSGTYCEVNADDCGTACQGGQCIDQVGSRVCLCTDGTWGQTCQAGPTITNTNPSSGPRAGGTTVTLTGSGFVGGTTVTVGGAAVTPNLISTNTLSFVTPPGVYGTVAIVVKGLNQQTASTSFTYAPLSFAYTGGVQRYTVPVGVSQLTVHAYGAGGGGGRTTAIRGGAGGHAFGTLSVDAGQVLAIVVGQGGARFIGLDGGGAGAGAGGGYSGVFFELVDGGYEAASALIVAGGGGGGGFFDNVTFGSSGGNGGGTIGGAGAVAGTTSLDARGLGGSQGAGGIGGCSVGASMAQCGQNGSVLQGGGGGVQQLGAPRLGATFGGGGGVGVGSLANAGGGGGGYFGGGGGANETAQGGGGGSGFLHASANNGALERGLEPGVPSVQSVVGYQPGIAVGGHVDGGSSGGNGLILLYP